MSVRHIVHERMIPGQAGDGISPPEAQILRNDLYSMPTIIAGNYTKRLGNYSNNLAAAIADLPDGGANGGEIQLDGEVPWTGGQVPSKVHMVGRGAGSTALVMDQGASVPALQLDATADVLLGGFSIIVPDGVTPTPGGGGIHIMGACDHVTIQDVHTDRAGRGINVQGAAGPNPGIVTNLLIANVRTNNSPVSTGIDLSDVEGYILRDVWAVGNFNNGVKLRKKVNNGFISGGFFTHNGTGGIGGGIAGYAGGDYLTIIGVDVSHNASDGLSFKSGGLNTTDPENYGYCRRVQFVGIRAEGNAFQGIDFNMVSADMGNPAAPVMASSSVSDCLLLGNGGDGLKNAGRNTTISNVHAVRNGANGFNNLPRAIDAQYVNCVAIANSQSAPNTYDGFLFYGDGGTVTNCYANGADSDRIGTAADYDALTAYHRHGFAFGSAGLSGRWHMSGCTSRKHATQTTSNGIRCYGTGGDIQIHQDGGGAPGSSAIYGGVGSTYFKISGANIGQYIKTSGAPNDLTGWQKVTAT